MAGGEAMDALLERRAALRAALAEVGREKKKIKRAQVKEAKVWVLTPFLKSVVLIAYVLAGYTADPAARYLATVARKRGWPDKSEGDLMREAEEVFLACDEDELAALTCLGNPSKCIAATFHSVSFSKRNIASQTTKSILEFCLDVQTGF